MWTFLSAVYLVKITHFTLHCCRICVRLTRQRFVALGLPSWTHLRTRCWGVFTLQGSRPVGIMVVNGTRSLFLMSVVPVTFGPIWPWFCRARQQFLHGQAPDRGPVFVDPCLRIYKRLQMLTTVCRHMLGTLSRCGTHFDKKGQIRLCCDRKSRAAWAQSFALWQQATIEFTCHDHSIIACSRHIYVWCCSSRTSHAW